MIRLGKYQHYKGGLYEVIGNGLHSETLEAYVIYKALYLPEDSPLWIRPSAMFAETVNIDGKILPRFRKLEDKESST